MAAPTSPYVTSTMMAYLLQNSFFGGAPSPLTVPNETITDQLILWTDSVIASSYQSVGYKIPFAALGSETWPDNQTVFLSFLSAIGTAAWISGYVLSPVPSRSPGMGSGESNPYAVVFNRIKNDILKNGLMYRADYYPGSRIEQVLAESYGPRLDYLEDYIDPTKNMLLGEYTNMVLEEFESIADMRIAYDYLYLLRETTAD